MTYNEIFHFLLHIIKDLEQDIKRCKNHPNDNQMCKVIDQDLEIFKKALLRINIRYYSYTDIT